MGCADPHSEVTENDVDGGRRYLPFVRDQFRRPREIVRKDVEPLTFFEPRAELHGLRHLLRAIEMSHVSTPSGRGSLQVANDLEMTLTS